MHITSVNSHPTQPAPKVDLHPVHPAAGTHASVVKAAQKEIVTQEKFEASKAVANEHALPKIEAKQPGVGDQVNMTA